MTIGAVQRLFYPAVMIVAVALLWGALALDLPLAAAPYLAIAVAGPLIVVGERIIPFRPAWAPDLHELLDDGAFLVMVQIVVPLVLGWIAIFGLQRLLSANGLTFDVWPQTWPLWAQVVLKILAGDLLRYGLHRASHRFPPLWRLHAVHHAPTKLYALNVFRFHPLDKGLQFLGDTLPFILMGVGPEVLAYYFVVYAVSGLFQHSNVDVRLGWFNYLISGPEVHRWHHSQVVAESDGNYAHTFAGWDVLFGTYIRPRRPIGPLGLLDPAYPRTFAGQMIAPLRYSGSAPKPDASPRL
ncbi:hypothetical protein BZG35_14205 [Brevundimonas sp. LM2]|uniref:sterol desaturase family protein n=1 Tax=Brevundimonas sp. LM2 TaxID=1938605 RepID=UPI000984094C|nr:sterol desaturase family protein [Brevundimonas sp. LM2]AQR62671.1 hypothetical protein BZG35_14205 [Brevundimonas sp. LM2]